MDVFVNTMTVLFSRPFGGGVCAYGEVFGMRAAEGVVRPDTSTS
jgi:hypothetical protein